MQKIILQNVNLLNYFLFIRSANNPNPNICNEPIKSTEEITKKPSPKNILYIIKDNPIKKKVKLKGRNILSGLKYITDLNIKRKKFTVLYIGRILDLPALFK